MARRPAVPGGRRHRVSTALSDDEIAGFDEARGMLDRSVYLRQLILTAVDMRRVLSRSRERSDGSVDQ